MGWIISGSFRIDDEGYGAAILSVLGVLALLVIVFGMAWILMMRQENLFISLREMWMPLLAGTTLAFIMLTAEQEQRNILEAIEAGATSYIVKPVSREVLEQNLQKVIKWLAKKDPDFAKDGKPTTENSKAEPANAIPAKLRDDLKPVVAKGIENIFSEIFKVKIVFYIPNHFIVIFFFVGDGMQSFSPDINQLKHYLSILSAGQPQFFFAYLLSCYLLCQ